MDATPSDHDADNAHMTDATAAGGDSSSAPGGAATADMTDADMTDAPVGAGAGALAPAAAVGLVALGGVLGTACRYELELVWPTAAGTFPWATFAINVSGAVVLGALLTLLTGRWQGHPAAAAARPLLTTGFLGAYTTWSTYMVETALLAKDGAVGMAFAYLAASLVAGTAAAHVGVWAGDRAPVPHR